MFKKKSNLRKVATIVACLAVSLCSIAQNVFQNSQLVFEDERKTFAIYACWNTGTNIDKGQYGDENNVIYYFKDFKYRVINKNDKVLEFSWRFPGGGGNNSWFYPHEDCYTTSGGASGGIPSIYYEMDPKTGKVTIDKPSSINFKFVEEPNRKPVKGKQSRLYVKLGESNLE